MTPPQQPDEEPTGSSGSSRRPRMWAMTPLAALLVFCLILRAPVTVIPPLLVQIRADLGLNAVVAGLVTSVPVLCFGVLTPFASRLVGLTGINHGALYCLGAVIAGSILRSAGGVQALFAGTLLIGAGLTIGNLVVPMLIGRDFRARTELVMGLYSSTINIAVGAATAVAAPVGLLIGWRWAAALVGTVLGAIALLAWIPVYPPGVRGPRPSIRRRAGLPAPPPTKKGQRRKREPIRRSMWVFIALITIAFSGQTLSYYAVTGWLPTALMDIRSMSQPQAGLAASFFQSAGIIGPLLVPVLSSALQWSPRRIVLVVGAAWASLPAGILLAPQLWLVWNCLGGMAQGGFFAVLMALLVRRSRNVDENRQATAVVQTIGYCVAATGPVVVGWVHDNIAGWDVPFAIILVVVLVMVASATIAVWRGIGDEVV